MEFAAPIDRASTKRAAKRPVAVVAIGGNSLVMDGRRHAIADQRAVVDQTVGHIATLIEQDWNIVITHGNGPQLGYSALRSELTQQRLHRVPLDACGADVQGSMGYMIQQSLRNELRQRRIAREPITLVTQVLVAPYDPAFQHPTKPIGLFYAAQQARSLRSARGWHMMEDAGRGWRRVVPSPQPVAIVEEESILTMIAADRIVIAAGGGGIPVVYDEDGNLRGVEAAVDKDLTAGLLASAIQADLLLISTAVERVALNYGKPDQRDLDLLTATAAKRYLSEGQFAQGSMEPKVRAVLGYLARGGRSALITCPESIGHALAGQTGTWILPDVAALQASLGAFSLADVTG